VGTDVRANEQEATPRYPGANPNVLYVGSITPTENAMGMTQHWGSFGGQASYAVPYNSLVTVVANTCEFQYGRKGASGASYYDYARLATINGGPTSAAIAAGVCQLVVSVNPFLSNADIKDVVISTGRKSKVGGGMDWSLFNFNNNPQVVRTIDAERAVLKAKSLHPSSASIVFPLLRVYGDFYQTEDLYTTSFPHLITHNYLSQDGTHRCTTHGTAGWEIDGYCSTGAMTNVQLWINGEKVYEGPPKNTWAGLLTRTEHRENLWQLRVVATASGGPVGVRDYVTTISSYPASVNTAEYATFGDEVDFATPASLGISVDAVDAYYIPRNMSLGRSYVAGPYVYIDFPQGSFHNAASMGMSTSARITAAWTDAATMASNLGFSSISDFAAFWSGSLNTAANLGISASSDFTAAWNDGQTIATTFGIQNYSTFSAVWSNATTMAASMGFSSMEHFTAFWSEALDLASTMGVSFSSSFFYPTTGSLPLATALGFGSVSAFTQQVERSQEIVSAFGFQSISDFVAVWEKGFSLPTNLGFSSISDFAASWSETQDFAASHEVAFSSSYYVITTGSVQLASALGFESISSFSQMVSNSQQIATALGFQSISDFVASWDGAATFGASLGLQLSAVFFEEGLAPTPFNSVLGFTTTAAFHLATVVPKDPTVLQPPRVVTRLDGRPRPPLINPTGSFS
jgi:hypothetical protein